MHCRQINECHWYIWVMALLWQMWYITFKKPKPKFMTFRNNQFNPGIFTIVRNAYVYCIISLRERYDLDVVVLANVHFHNTKYRYTSYNLNCISSMKTGSTIHISIYYYIIITFSIMYLYFSIQVSLHLITQYLQQIDILWKATRTIDLKMIKDKNSQVWQRQWTKCLQVLYGWWNIASRWSTLV